MICLFCKKVGSMWKDLAFSFTFSLVSAIMSGPCCLIWMDNGIKSITFAQKHGFYGKMEQIVVFTWIQILVILSDSKL
jgi:hypothetical protein